MPALGHPRPLPTRYQTIIAPHPQPPALTTEDVSRLGQIPPGGGNSLTSFLLK